MFPGVPTAAVWPVEFRPTSWLTNLLHENADLTGKIWPEALPECRLGSFQTGRLLLAKRLSLESIQTNFSRRRG